MAAKTLQIEPGANATHAPACPATQPLAPVYRTCIKPYCSWGVWSRLLLRLPQSRSRLLPMTGGLLPAASGTMATCRGRKQE